MDFNLPEKPVSGTCQMCGEKLNGRLGKKFCDDQCRAQYHNSHKRVNEKWIQGLNKILRKNRTVLKKLNPVGYSTVRQEVLKKNGFDDRFYTHQFRTLKGEVYYFCYEWGYQVLPNNKVLIVNWQKFMDPISTLSSV